METIKKTIRETGTKIQTETSKFATDHEEEINKVKKRLSETKTKAEASKFGKKVKENADKFAQDHEEGITKNKTRLSEAKIKIEETVKNALAEKRDDEEVVANDEEETSPTSTGVESDKETATDTASESKELESRDQSLDTEEKHDEDDVDNVEATKYTADELVEETTSETLDAVYSDDAKEPISINESDGKPNYLKSTKQNDDDANKENTLKEEKLSNQLNAKLIGAKANLTAFLRNNKKDVQNKERKEGSKKTKKNKDDSSASSESQTHVANLAATTNETSTNTKNTKTQSSKENKLVGFMATAETASKNVLENARDAFKRATSKRRVAIVTKDLKSDANKKQFEEKETDKEETPVDEKWSKFETYICREIKRGNKKTIKI